MRDYTAEIDAYYGRLQAAADRIGPNEINRAIETLKRARDGGRLMALSDIRLHVPLDDMQVVEDLHLAFGHLMMSILSGED